MAVPARIAAVMPQLRLWPYQWVALDQCYTEPHRRYHTWDHIDDLWEKFDRYQSYFKQPHLVGLAILYHDAVYDTTRADPDNVAASRNLFNNQAADLGLTETERSYVAQLIMATATHKARTMAGEPHYSRTGRDFANDVRLFLDLDMSILAAEPAAFDRYEQAVRAEYSQYNDLEFAGGRANFLAPYAKADPLETAKLYQHPVTRQAYGSQTAINLARSAPFWNSEHKRLQANWPKRPSDPQLQIRWPRLAL